MKRQGLITTIEELRKIANELEKEVKEIILKRLKKAYENIEKSGQEIDGTNVWKEELKDIKKCINYMEKENEK